MKTRPEPPSTTVRGLLILLLCGLLAACDGPDDPARPATGKTDGETETSQDREKKARALLERGRTAPPLEKVEIFGTLVGRYPETSVVPEAYLRLVRVLVDPDLDRPEQALKRTRAFADRRPETTLWAECFRWLHVQVRNPERKWDQGLRHGIDESFMDCLDRALGSGRFKGTGSDEAVLRLERARLLAATGRKPEAVAEYGRAAATLPIENQRAAMRILVEMGELQAETPGGRAAAAAAFARAIELSKTYTRSYSTEGLLRRVEQLGLELPATRPGKDG